MTTRWMGRVPGILLTLALLAAPAASATGWRQHVDPTAAGWSAAGLEEARRVAGEAGSTSVLLVEDGTVVVAWGAVDRPLPLHSMRKGLYNALVGMLVEEGELELAATLEELGVAEAEGLSEVEGTATLEHLLTARSGVYRVAAYEPSSMRRSRPERGAHRPGEHWFYNNWDFNLVAHLVERAAGRDLGELFRQRVAVPLGMEDFSPGDVFPFLEPSRASHPAVLFRMSARDLARFGQLYLQGGVWEGERLLPEAWIRSSWTPASTFPPGSPFGEGNGFGYLWWIHPAADGGEGPFAGHAAYLTRGSGGQVLAVVPDLGLVLVHQAVSPEAGFGDAMRVLGALLAAREEGPAGEEVPRGGRTGSDERAQVGAASRSGAGTPAATRPLEPRPFEAAPPPQPSRTAVPWSRPRIEALVGEYRLAPGAAFRVHALDGRLFALPLGPPLAEVELFTDAGGTLFSPAVDLVLEEVRGEGGAVEALEGRMEGRPVRLERTDPE